MSPDETSAPFAARPAGATAFLFANKFAWLAAALGLAAFIAIGLIGLGKAPYGYMLDFKWFFAGGKCFWLGSQMYDEACFNAQFAILTTERALAAVSYPPHFGPFSALFGLAPFPVGTLGITAGNMVGAAFVAWLLTRMIVSPSRDGAEHLDGAPVLDRKFALAFVFGCGGLWGVMWSGQVTLLIAICVWVGLRAAARSHDVLAGVLLAIASVKPQIATIFFIWILLNGRWRILIISAATAALLSLPIVILLGPVETISQWIEGLVDYRDYDVNQLGNATILGLPNSLSYLGLNAPLWLAFSIATILLIVIRQAKRVDPFSDGMISVLVCLQMSIYARAIDTVLLLPVLAVLWPRVKSTPFQLATFLFAIFAICVPDRLFEKLSPGDLVVHLRTLMILLLLWVFSVGILRDRKPSTTDQANIPAC